MMPKLTVDLTPEMLAVLDEMVAGGIALDRADALRGILRDILKAKEAAQGGASAGDTGGTVTIQMRRIDPFE
jgi:Arc/MetJ-type ribon-helix-helix transcriptional regulator